VFNAAAIAQTVDNAHQYNVIVIGAGAAGLAAAQDLYEHGVKDVLIIEARDRIGGRVWTTCPWGTATDLGASWIHNVNNNPMATLAQKYGVDTVATVYESADLTNKFTSYAAYDNNGKKISPTEMNMALELIHKFNHAIEDHRLNLKENSSYEDAITAFAQQENLQADKLQLLNFFAGHMMEGEFGADLQQISVKAANGSHSSSLGKDVLPSGGYIRLFSELVKNMAISLNNPVTTINYEKNGVTVTTKKGVYHAKYAIVTLPLGVLQAGTVKFAPELPKEKLAAIENLRMGTFNKIYLLFDKPFWEPDIEWISAMPNQGKPTDNYEALNLYKYSKQPILLFFTAGSFSKKTEGWSDQKIIDDVMRILKLMYSNIPAPSAYMITRWGKDPFACGSYSYPSITSTSEDYKQLAAPVANKLFFAGEATSTNNPSTVHGAYLSGIYAANLIRSKKD